MSTRFLYLSLLALLVAAIQLHAQQEKISFGLGTKTYFINYSPLAIESDITTIPLLRVGGAFWVRYHLNKQGKIRWGPIQNKIEFYLLSGLQVNWLSHAYSINETMVKKEYAGFELPIQFILQGTPGGGYYRNSKVSGYARLGVNACWIPQPGSTLQFSSFDEYTHFNDLHFILCLTGGLYSENKTGDEFAVGLFSKIGLGKMAQAEISGTALSNPIRFDIFNLQVGLECNYFFGERKKPTLPKEWKPAILCPRF
jgi:hypothetical protein